jgi:hypothetical protein
MILKIGQKRQVILPTHAVKHLNRTPKDFANGKEAWELPPASLLVQ